MTSDTDDEDGGWASVHAAVPAVPHPFPVDHWQRQNACVLPASPDHSRSSSSCGTAATLSSAPATTSLSCRPSVHPATGVPMNGPTPRSTAFRAGHRAIGHPPRLFATCPPLTWFEEGELLTSEETGSSSKPSRPEWAEGNRHDLHWRWLAALVIMSRKTAPEPSLMSWQPATDPRNASTASGCP